MLNVHGLPRRELLKTMATLGALSALSALPGSRLLAAASNALDEEGAYRMGLQAYVYGYPLIYFARLRYQRMVVGDPMLKRRHRWGEWLHRSVVVTPDVVGAPQTDILYSNMWLDLHSEPYILTIPRMDGRYWSVQFCDLFGTTFGLPNHRSLPNGGRVAVVGPNWSGQLPGGIDLILHANMPESFNVLRLFFANEQDRLKAIDYQQQFQVAPLSAYLAGKTSVPGIAGNLSQPLMPEQDPLADFKTLQAMWQECPPPAADAALIAPYAAIGLTAGAQGFDELTVEVLRGMQRAERDARQQVIDASRSIGGARTANGWTVPKLSIGYYDDADYLYRAAVALAGTVALPVAENPYYTLQKDDSRAFLSGDGRYELHFSADQIPLVGAFWSLHAYSPRYTVIDNPINRYAIGDRTPGLQYDADGSLTVYLQASDPGSEKRSNWLPIKQGELFWLITRGYEPQGAMKELRWSGPRLTKLS
jgi:hypothetical protein